MFAVLAKKDVKPPHPLPDRTPPPSDHLLSYLTGSTSSPHCQGFGPSPPSPLVTLGTMGLPPTPDDPAAPDPPPKVPPVLPHPLNEPPPPLLIPPPPLPPPPPSPLAKELLGDTATLESTFDVAVPPLHSPHVCGGDGRKAEGYVAKVEREGGEQVVGERSAVFRTSSSFTYP